MPTAPSCERGIWWSAWSTLRAWRKRRTRRSVTQSHPVTQPADDTTAWQEAKVQSRAEAKVQSQACWWSAKIAHGVLICFAQESPLQLQPLKTEVAELKLWKEEEWPLALGGGWPVSLVSSPLALKRAAMSAIPAVLKELAKQRSEARRLGSEHAEAEKLKAQAAALFDEARMRRLAPTASVSDQF